MSRKDCDRCVLVSMSIQRGLTTEHGLTYQEWEHSHCNRLFSGNEAKALKSWIQGPSICISTTYASSRGRKAVKVYPNSYIKYHTCFPEEIPISSYIEALANMKGQLANKNKQSGIEFCFGNLKTRREVTLREINNVVELSMKRNLWNSSRHYADSL